MGPFKWGYCTWPIDPDLNLLQPYSLGPFLVSCNNPFPLPSSCACNLVYFRFEPILNLILLLSSLLFLILLLLPFFILTRLILLLLSCRRVKMGRCSCNSTTSPHSSCLTHSDHSNLHHRRRRLHCRRHRRVRRLFTWRKVLWSYAVVSTRSIFYEDNHSPANNIFRVEGKSPLSPPPLLFFIFSFSLPPFTRCDIIHDYWVSIPGLYLFISFSSDLPLASSPGYQSPASK